MCSCQMADFVHQVCLFINKSCWDFKTPSFILDKFRFNSEDFVNIYWNNWKKLSLSFMVFKNVDIDNLKIYQLQVINNFFYLSLSVMQARLVSVLWKFSTRFPHGLLSCLLLFCRYLISCASTSTSSALLRLAGHDVLSTCVNKFDWYC